MKKFFSAIFLASALLVTGCGGDDAENQETQEMPTRVKAIKVLTTNSPLTLSYSGQVVDRDEIKVQSKVNGTITEKYVKGGEEVVEGQPLFKVDDRQYRAAVLQAEANLAKSEKQLAKERIDLQRYDELYQSNAVSEQTFTNQKIAVVSQEDEVSANAALVQKAKDDLADTIVYAPMSGRLGIDDVAVGTLAVAGNTTLATIGVVDPVFVQFAVSEQEYLRLSKGQTGPNESGAAQAPNFRISLTLADGSKYPYTGQFAEYDRTLGNETGTLTIRTIFKNPDALLVPGMYTRVEITGLTIPNTMLVPERALQQLLGETMVIVVQDNKSAVRKITLGEKIGSYYIVKDGLKPDDLVIVEGLTMLRDGMPLEVTQVTANEMGFSFNPSEKIFDVEKNANAN